MSVGKGTEAIMVISRVRRGDTYAYKVLGTNANTASSNSLNSRDNPRSRYNYVVYLIDRRCDVSGVPQFLGQYLNPDSLVPFGTWTGTVFMVSQSWQGKAWSCPKLECPPQT